mgnify:CR=1 FL=1
MDVTSIRALPLQCSCCHSGVLGEKLFTIHDLPLVDSFLESQSASFSVPCYDVELRACKRCGTVQLSNLVDTSSIYKNYIYSSSSSPDLSSHFESYVDDLEQNCGFSINNYSKVLEVGINDGLLAKKIIARFNCPVLGVDPSPQTKEICEEGIRIINDFFTWDALVKSNADLGGYNLVIANNVISHIPELHKTLSLVSKLLDDQGVFVFEVQSASHLLSNCVFDYIYHEHLFYHTLGSLELVLEDAGLTISSVTTTQAKGGSYRVYARRGTRGENLKLSQLKYFESFYDVKSRASWERLEVRLASVNQELRHFIDTAKNKGTGRIFGYGACATGTVLQRYFGIERDMVGIIDDNRRRQGLFSPKFGLKVMPPGSLSDGDSVIVLAWRHYDYMRCTLSGLNHMVPLKCA